MAARNVSFNGNVLQTDHITVSDIDDQSIPVRTLSIYALGHANASRIPYDQYSSRAITITGTIYGDSIPDLDARVDLFKSWFNGIDKNLDIDFNNSTRRYIATMQDIQIARPGGLAFANFTVSFVCSMPFGKDVNTTVLCNYTQRNLIPGFNAQSFTTNTGGWLAYNGAGLARTSLYHYDASPSLSVATTGTGSFPLQGVSFPAITVTSGLTYTLSFYVKGLVAGITVRCQITDTADTYQSIVTDGTFQRISVTRTASGTSITPYVIIESANTSVLTIYTDCYILEQASSPSTYFDSNIRTSNSYTDTFTFGGTAPLQQPIITTQFVTGTLGAGTVYIGNNANGQQIAVTRTFAVNDVLVVDCTLKAVFVNGVEVDFVGAFPEFPPGTGVLAYNDSVNTASRTQTYKVEYYPQYL